MELTLTLHKAALLFPPKSAKAQAALCASIKAVGLKSKLAVNFQYEIIDGRHRWLALQSLEMPVNEGMVERLDVSSADALVLAAARNMESRTLKTAQRAMVAADLVLNLRANGNDRLTVEVAAERYGASKRLVAHGIKLREADSPLAELIIQGHLTVNAAVKLTAGPKETRDAVVELFGIGDVKAAKALLCKKKSKQSAKLDDDELVRELFDLLPRISQLPSHLVRLADRVNNGTLIVRDIKRARNLRSAIEVGVVNAKDTADAVRVAIAALETLIGGIERAEMATAAP